MARATWHTVRPMLPIPETTIRALAAMPERRIPCTAAGNAEESITASSSGVSALSGNTLDSGTTAYSAKPPSRSIPRWRIHGQMLSEPRTHHSQTPQPTTASATTSEPGDGVAGESASTISPTISWPRMRERPPVSIMPAAICWWNRPSAEARTRTSAQFGGRSGTSMPAISSRPSPNISIARMVIGRLPASQPAAARTGPLDNGFRPPPE